jgi:glyoxylase-like metal-dependent hydrolase (beta-lactamase superfamily II)
MAAYLRSLDALLRLDPPLAAIAPGHGRLIDEPAAVVRGIVAHRLEREQRVVAALARTGRSDLDQLLPVVYADIDPQLLPVARSSLWAHLRKLEADGRVVVDGGGPGAIDSFWMVSPAI